MTAAGSSGPSQDRRIPAGKIHLRCREAGSPDGPLLILLHGFPESGRAWGKLMGPFADNGFHVVAPDLRGYGGSDVPEGRENYRLDLLVADIVGLADSLGAAVFTLAGHDWGGIIAWAVAARHPDRLTRLVILNAPHPDTMASEMRRHPRQALRSLYVGLFQLPVGPELMLSAFAYRTLRRALSETSRPGAFSAIKLDEYVSEWSAPGRLTAMLNYYRALRLPAGPLGRIPVPTLILWGMQDRFLGAHLAMAAAGMCDDARLVRFDDATHWIHHEEVGRIVAELAHP